MPYKVEITKLAIKNLSKIQQSHAANILAKIKTLSNNPYANNNVKKLQGYDNVFRLRVGNYRIIYELLDAVLIIKVINIDVRGNIYD